MSRPANERFDAFLSHRREGLDRRWADWLQTAIEAYRTPKSIGVHRRLHVLRDDPKRSTAPSLSATIEEALETSRYLLVVASPRSAGSRWGGREVRWFLDHGRRDRVLVLWIDGDPSTAFPPSLRGASEPLAVSVRG